MRSTVVPAQITTVEDKITGNISVSQLLLLVLPIFAGSLLFVLLPPFYSYSPYKIVLIVTIVSFCTIMAVRIRGRLVLHWCITLTKFYLRPRYYVFNKNHSHMRTPNPKPLKQVSPAPKVEKSKDKATLHIPKLTTADRVAIEGLINDPATKLHFKTNRKGEMYVHITETS